jgi:hypothetical protein
LETSRRTDRADLLCCAELGPDAAAPDALGDGAVDHVDIGDDGTDEEEMGDEEIEALLREVMIRGGDRLAVFGKLHLLLLGMPIHYVSPNHLPQLHTSPLVTLTVTM